MSCRRARSPAMAACAAMAGCAPEKIRNPAAAAEPQASASARACRASCFSSACSRLLRASGAEQLLDPQRRNLTLLFRGVLQLGLCVVVEACLDARDHLVEALARRAENEDVPELLLVREVPLHHA